MFFKRKLTEVEERILEGLKDKLKDVKRVMYWEYCRTSHLYQSEKYFVRFGDNSRVEFNYTESQLVAYRLPHREPSGRTMNISKQLSKKLRKIFMIAYSEYVKAEEKKEQDKLIEFANALRRKNCE